MWPLCTANSFLWLLLPFAIGLLTGWWAWARSSTRSSASDNGYELSRNQGSPEAVFAGAGSPSAHNSSMNAGASRVTAANSGAANLRAIEVTDTAPVAAPAVTAIGIPAAVGQPDDLRRIKGVGPKLDELLQSLGVRRFDQIAGWGAAEIGKVDSHLGAFSGRIERDNWVEQAKLLARGAFEEFERGFGDSGRA